MEIVGHGGAGHFFPGNSRQSIEQALEIGVDRVEIDVQRAARDQLVLVHDDEVRIDGKRVRVRTMDPDDIHGALDGFLTLDEAIELVGTRAALLIDMKSPGYESLVAATIRKANIASTAIVSSTYAWSLRAVKRAESAVAIGLSTGHISTVMRRNALVTATSGVLAAVSPLPIIATARVIDAEHLMLNYRICTSRFVRRAHRHGLSVYAWTVNHPRAIRRQVENGVDAIISNRPDLVRDFLEKADTGVPERR